MNTIIIGIGMVASAFVLIFAATNVDGPNKRRDTDDWLICLCARLFMWGLMVIALGLAVEAFFWAAS